jgi:hypothetical protein
MFGFDLFSLAVGFVGGVVCSLFAPKAWAKVQAFVGSIASKL